MYIMVSWHAHYMSHSTKRVPFASAMFDEVHKAQNMCQNVFPKLKASNSIVLVNKIYEKMLFLKSNILFLDKFLLVQGHFHMSGLTNMTFTSKISPNKCYIFIKPLLFSGVYVCHYIKYIYSK